MAITTAEQLLVAQHLGRCELIRGEFRQLIPPGYEHGKVTVNVAAALKTFVSPGRLGTVIGEVGFHLERDPDTVRAPDVAFLSAGRDQSRRGYYPGTPDIAVEVLSPNDNEREVAEKVAEWLAFGTDTVWVADPYARTVTVHRSGQEPVLLGEGDTLTAETLLPGFALPVREIFA